MNGGDGDGGGGGAVGNGGGLVLQNVHAAQSHLRHSPDARESHLPKRQLGTVGPLPFPSVGMHLAGGAGGGAAKLESDIAVHATSRGLQSSQSVPKEQLE